MGNMYIRFIACLCVGDHGPFRQKLFNQYVQNGQQNDVQSADGLKTGITIKSSFATGILQYCQSICSDIQPFLIKKRELF